MPLRLRRGTDSERQLITPLDGELIYTTDTKEVWVGDGSTQGGIKVTGDIPDNVGDLNDVDTTTFPPQVGYVLKWDGSNFTPQPDVDTTTIFEGINDLPDVDLSTPPNDGEALVWNGTSQSWVAGVTAIEKVNDDPSPLLGGILGLNSFGIDGTGNIDIDGNISANLITSELITGNFTGSVFADDSTLVIDGIDGSIRALIKDVAGNIIVDTDNNRISTKRLEIADDDSQLEIIKQDTQDLSSYTGKLGDVIFQTRGTDGAKSYGILTGYTSGVIIAHNDNGVDFPAETLNTITKTGVALGGINPTARLDVRGDIIASSSITPGTYADATARDTAITSPAQGMMIFNIALQKFQGYVSDTGLASGGVSNSTPGWIDLN